MTDTCATCRFFRLKEPQHIYGDCHRMPPQFELSVNVQRDRYEGNEKITVSRFPHARWPNIEQTEWCGEHQPIPQLKMFSAIAFGQPREEKTDDRA